MPPGTPNLGTSSSRAWLESLRLQSQQSIVGTSNQITSSTSTATPPVTTISLVDNPIIAGTQHLTLPVGTTSGRPSPTVGMIRYNNTLSDYEAYTTAGGWDNLASIKSRNVNDTPNIFEHYFLSYNTFSAVNNKIQLKKLQRYYHTDTALYANVSTGETTLATVDIEANIFEGIPGATMEVSAYGNYVGNANTKQLQLYVGGTSVFDSGALAVDATGTWLLEAKITFMAAGTLSIVGKFMAIWTSSSIAVINTSVSGLVYTNPITINLTGTSNAASDDVTQTNYYLNFKEG